MELFTLHAGIPADKPRLQVMAARRLELSPRDVVPVHCHAEKEKLYRQEAGLIRVLIFFGNSPRWFTLTSNDELPIPPRYPHGVWCVEGPSVTKITLSSQDASDVVWEVDADRLIENKHLVQYH